jgi:hypothetical protein
MLPELEKSTTKGKELHISYNPPWGIYTTLEGEIPLKVTPLSYIGNKY